MCFIKDIRSQADLISNYVSEYPGMEVYKVVYVKRKFLKKIYKTPFKFHKIKIGKEPCELSNILIGDLIGKVIASGDYYIDEHNTICYLSDGTFVKEKEPKITHNSYIEIDEGIHSFDNKYAALKAVASLDFLKWKCIILKAYIPEGSIYFENKEGEIVSTRLRITNEQIK